VKKDKLGEKRGQVFLSTSTIPAPKKTNQRNLSAEKVKLKRIELQ
jgi:hypothetical protein